MATPVYVPPCSVDAANVAQFRDAVADLAGDNDGILVDCTDVRFMSLAAMRVLENTARGRVVIVVNPSPVVHLLATVFGLEVVLPGFEDTARARDHRQLTRDLSFQRRRNRLETNLRGAQLVPLPRPRPLHDSQQPVSKHAGHIQTKS